MASEYNRILEPTLLGPNWIQPKDEWLDLGAYSKFVAHCRILKQQSPTNPGNVRLQHSAVPQDEAFVDIPNMSWPLDSGGGVQSTDAFLRYVRVVTDNNVADDPVALIDLVSKE